MDFEDLGSYPKLNPALAFGRWAATCTAARLAQLPPTLLRVLLPRVFLRYCCCHQHTSQATVIWKQNDY